MRHEKRRARKTEENEERGEGGRIRREKDGVLYGVFVGKVTRGSFVVGSRPKQE